MAFFRSGVDHLLRAMADMIGPVLAENTQDPNSVDESWIPKQHLAAKKKPQAPVVRSHSYFNTPFLLKKKKKKKKIP